MIHNINCTQLRTLSWAIPIKRTTSAWPNWITLDQLRQSSWIRATTCTARCVLTTTHSLISRKMVLRLRIHWRVRSSGETCGSKCLTTSWVPLSISISCLQTCQVKKLRTQLNYKWDRLLASFRISFHLISSRNRENSSLTLCFKLLLSHLHLAISRIRSLTTLISSLRRRIKVNLLFNGSRGDKPICRMDKNQCCRT